MGNAYHEKGAYDQAIEAYQKAVGLNPKRDEAYYNMGIAYYRLGLFDEVIKAHSQALKTNPNQSEAYTNLFELQLTQNQAFDETLEKEYIKRFKAQKEIFIKYEMLKVFQNIHNRQASQLEQWQENYRGVSLGGWSFDELRSWIEPMEESETKTKLLETLKVFENHG
jgi:tetratricopeptide (TPR) repeat protein